jgi:hypothetical protein
MSESPDAPLRRRPPADTTLLLQTPIAGVAHYDFADTDFPLEGGMMLELAREPDHPHQQRAIAVLTPDEGHKLGYIPGRHTLIPARLIEDDYEVIGRVENIQLPRSERTTPHLPRIDIAIFLRA